MMCCCSTGRVLQLWKIIIIIIIKRPHKSFTFAVRGMVCVCVKSKF